MLFYPSVHFLVHVCDGLPLSVLSGSFLLRLLPTAFVDAPDLTCVRSKLNVLAEVIPGLFEIRLILLLVGLP